MTAAQLPLAAAAIDGSEFDPGYIISDSQFYASTSMSEAEIQAFLNSKVAVCRAGYVCLKDYTTATTNKAADPMCTGYQGAASEKAARIIHKVAIACGISPKVLLVMLQKEQGLITDDWPVAGQYRAAMGAGCPDTAGCNPDQAGFFQQVYFAAWYLIRYGAPPGTGPGTPYTSGFNAYSDFSDYAPGAAFNIAYHPKTYANPPTCGAQSVVIRNQPTASLYTYTPYTPNAAALANIGTTGDTCSSYGNRNFWAFYYSWFGNPTTITPKGVTTSRLGGINRFETSVKISVASGSTTEDIVYIANGWDFPDALSGAPAAIHRGAPLLLVTPEGIPAPVASELSRLKPKQIVVLGSEASVSAAAVAELAPLGATITRYGGIDRYETSRQVAEGTFLSGSSLAYVATGEGFADALSAASAAGIQHAPVILVPGSAPTVGPETLATLSKLGVTKVIIAGGPTTVSNGIQKTIDDAPGISVERIAGANRFATASALNRAFFTTSASVFVASGRNFPDALAGAVLAGSTGSALYLAEQSCLHRITLQDIIDLKATKMVVLGGTPTLATSVEQFANCD